VAHDQPTAPATELSSRRGSIVESAYGCLAVNGLSGLRMRDVAAGAGVNIATVHYYLTSKTEMIQAVVEYAHGLFRQHATPPADPDPARRLPAHLRKLFQLLEDDPRLGHVLAELALHAERDPVVAAIVTASERRWRESLQAMMAPLPARLTRPVANLVILTVKGACLPPTSRADRTSARQELASYVEQRLASTLRT
jgi:AcrR family transcriptional regulator